MKPIKNDTPGIDKAAEFYGDCVLDAPLYQLVREGRLRRVTNVDVRWIEDDLVPIDSDTYRARIVGEFRVDNDG